MERKALFGRGSSLLISSPALVLFGAGVLLALRLGSGGVAGVCLFFLLLGLAARWWGSRAIRGVSIQVECPRPRLFPGQQTQLIYHLENGKALPLIWLELSQNAPEEGCLTPDDAFESYLQPAPDQEGSAPVPALRQSFSFLGSWQTIQVENTWTAQRRGLYRVHRLVARSGDGFGLVQGEQPLPAGQIPAIAVSLGDPDTLIQHPASMTHVRVPKAVREEVGITDGMLRFSVGLEHIDDLIADFEQAWAAL